MAPARTLRIHEQLSRILWPFKPGAVTITLVDSGCGLKLHLQYRIPCPPHNNLWTVRIQLPVVIFVLFSYLDKGPCLEVTEL